MPSTFYAGAYVEEVATGPFAELEFRPQVIRDTKDA
jgi:hypothetical protein